jgi:hypothetical protein
LLAITTEKQEGDDKTDFHTLLRYNDIARRVYPPYLGDKNTCSLKQDSKLLPVMISLFKEKGKSISEDFKPIDLEANKEKDFVSMSKIIKELLAPFILKENHDMDMEKGRIYYTPFIDDRMFIVSYYADKGLSDELKQRCCDGYVYETSDGWYRFIFVDGNYANIANNTMKEELIRRHTYARWADYASFFGMSRYSFVLLCSTDAPSYLKQHMKSMYYQIALIVLFQRAMLLKFAGDVDEVTKKFDMDSLSKIKEETKKLHGDFIRFINKYWFIEVTPQEQGIEIYNQWMELLNLEKLYKEVHREVSELAEYVENRIESETNQRLACITYIGLPLVIIGLILSFWPIYEEKINKANTLKDLFEKALSVHSFNYLWKVSLISIGILIFFWCVFSKFSRCKMISWIKDRLSKLC